jgi:hypothetical protein
MNLQFAKYKEIRDMCTTIRLQRKSCSKQDKSVEICIVHVKAWAVYSGSKQKPLKEYKIICGSDVDLVALYSTEV